jgi:hypothetical protein
MNCTSRRSAVTERRESWSRQSAVIGSLLGWPLTGRRRKRPPAWRFHVRRCDVMLMSWQVRWRRCKTALLILYSVLENIGWLTINSATSLQQFVWDRYLMLQQQQHNCLRCLTVRLTEQPSVTRFAWFLLLVRTVKSQSIETIIRMKDRLNHCFTFSFSY